MLQKWRILFDKVCTLSVFIYLFLIKRSHLNFICLLIQFDPEGFGEIPLEDFLVALRSPEWKTEIPANKRDILLTRAKESRVEAVTFQDFVNVVSLHNCMRISYFIMGMSSDIILIYKCENGTSLASICVAWK